MLVMNRIAKYLFNQKKISVVWVFTMTCSAEINNAAVKGAWA